MEEKKVRVSWIKNGNEYQRVEGECDNVETIPPGIYTIHLSDKKGWWLEFYREKFTFDYKVYGCDEGFIDYFMKTYNNTNGNLGVMFNGVKGTGKTVTAKVLANTLGLPVIIVKGMGDFNPALMEYLSSFNFDCIYFFDEFEKNFKEDDPTVLQIMDGVYNSEFRKVFLLTTNRTWVNENLLSRPSRIRYVKEFRNISKELIDEYIEDNLFDKDAKSDVIDYIDTLDVSTIDILKSCVQEINIHGRDSFRKNRKLLNANLKSIRYICYFLPTDKTQKLSVNDFIHVIAEHEKIFKNNEFCLSEFKPVTNIDLNFECNEGFSARLEDNTIIVSGDFNGSVPGSVPYISKRKNDEFESILPSSGYTQSEKMSDDTIRKLAEILHCSWRVDIDIPFRSLEVGDLWYQGEPIIYIDHNKKVIVTDTEGQINYYYVTNPEEKNSNYFNENYSKYSFLY